MQRIQKQSRMGYGSVKKEKEKNETFYYSQGEFNNEAPYTWFSATTEVFESLV